MAITEWSGGKRNTQLSEGDKTGSCGGKIEKKGQKVERINTKPDPTKCDRCQFFESCPDTMAE